MPEGLSKEDIKVIREFNNNLRWLRLKDLKENYCASAEDIYKVTGWSKERIRGERERGTIRFKKEGFHYRYDLSSLAEVYKQKIIQSDHRKNSQSVALENEANELAEKIAAILVKRILDQFLKGMPRV